MKKRLTPPQQLALERISSEIESKGWAPTRRELQEYLGYSSPKSADDVLKALETKGYIVLAAGVSRGIRLVPFPDTNQTKTDRKTALKLQESDIDADKVYALVTDYESKSAKHRNLSEARQVARVNQGKAKRRLEEVQANVGRYQQRNREIPAELSQDLKTAESECKHATKTYERLQDEFRTTSRQTATSRTLIEKIASQLKAQNIELLALEGFC